MPEAVREKQIRRGDRGLSMGAFYALSLFVSRFVAILCFDVRIHRPNRIPARGAVILASNHASFLDPWLVGAAQPRRICYLARDTLFRVPILGWLIRNYDAHPVQRETTAARQGIEVCLRILEHARKLIFFPEGTRSRDGRLQPLKRGLTLIRKRSRAAVVPVLVRGTHACWPRDRLLPAFGSTSIHYGEVIPWESSESSEAFQARLWSSYLDLAREVDAPELLPEDSVAEGGVVTPPSINNEEPPELLEAARRSAAPLLAQPIHPQRQMAAG
jgi:1-acyl-sn-glycerol-3-phosphate acyltransferase